MTKLIVATRLGVERPATKREVCQHWMVAQDAWSSGGRHHRCAYCGHSEIRREPA
jgi:hypothetical protein